MTELADAKVHNITECGDNKLPDIEITLRFNQMKRILGIEIPNEKCIQILENLGFKYLGKNDFSAKFLVPGYRVNDVTREIDLIEEIARINGYDKIEPTLPKKTQSVEISNEIKTLDLINKVFIGQGFNEAVTSSLIGKPLLDWIGASYDDKKSVKVSNPQSDEYTMLRQDFLPSIIQTVKYNFDQGQKNFWIYEIGKTYEFNGVINEKNSGVEEKRMLSGTITGDISKGKWHNSQKADFYALKGVIEDLFSKLNLENRVIYEHAEDSSYFHPGRSTKIRFLGKNPVTLGVFGELHPDINERCKLAQLVYVFEINLEEILKSLNYAIPKYKQLPLYPAVNRDIAFIIPKSIYHNDIAQTIKKSASNELFKGAEIFDIYEGTNIPKESKSLAYRITLQDSSATLTDERVNVEMDKIRAGLKKAYSEIDFR